MIYIIVLFIAYVRSECYTTIGDVPNHIIDTLVRNCNDTFRYHFSVINFGFDHAELYRRVINSCPSNTFCIILDNTSRKVAYHHSSVRSSLDSKIRKVKAILNKDGSQLNYRISRLIDAASSLTENEERNPSKSAAPTEVNERNVNPSKPAEINIYSIIPLVIWVILSIMRIMLVTNDLRKGESAQTCTVNNRTSYRRRVNSSTSSSWSTSTSSSSD